jgi:hypothetical protein
VSGAAPYKPTAVGTRDGYLISASRRKTNRSTQRGARALHSAANERPALFTFRRAQRRVLLANHCASPLLPVCYSASKRSLAFQRQSTSGRRRSVSCVTQTGDNGGRRRAACAPECPYARAFVRQALGGFSARRAECEGRGLRASSARERVGRER